jgi:hypothetical protein
MAKSRQLLNRLLVPVEIVLSALYRLVPYYLHPPNFAPVGAMGLYGGARLPLWQALATPLAIMLLSDTAMWLLWGWEPFNLWVYFSLIVYVFLGRFARRSNSAGRLAVLSLIGSIQFFLITNFGYWFSQRHQPGALYPPTLAGLIACYLAALVFFPWTIGGDLLFSAMLVGVHERVEATVTDEEDVPGEVPAAEAVPAEPEVQPQPEKSPA